MKNLFIFLLIYFCCEPSGNAAIKLPALISDNMVLQQKSRIILWGWASAGEKITVNATWHKKNISVVADAGGNWKITIPTVKAGGPYNIRFSSGKQSIAVSNVLLGEVWLASGQSNMEFPMGKGEGWRNGVHNYATEIPLANYPNIRMIDVPNKVSDEVQNDFIGNWKICDTNNVKDFSGVAYFFAKEIFTKTGLPVGIINSTWGGTPAESWTKKEVLESDTGFVHILERYQKMLDAYPDAYKKYQAAFEKWLTDTSTKKKKPSAPSGTDWNKSPYKLYNGMIAPLLNYKLKGIIWYQGESNANYAWQYRRLFPAMIKSWRKDFSNKAMPFYFVQITPHKGQNAVIREAQLFSWQTVPNTGLVVTTDYGDTNNIHPRNKEVVGRRLSLWALKNEYGKKEIIASGPTFSHIKREGNKLRIYFKNADGLYSKNNAAMQQFSIAANTDTAFKKATAIIEKNTVLVWNNEVSQPAQIRYGWQNLPVAELYNSSHLPASPFRTDKRIVATQGKE
ncbi:MAG: sialate O-acetylesterase [Sphingobacteriales bacterium]|nr:MAG: sialate O-acetylesterase [Sphingobacteriales bacterium]